MMLTQLASNALASPRLAWILAVWPLVTFALISLFFGRRPRLASGLAIFTTLGVLALSVLALARSLVAAGPSEVVWPWFTTGRLTAEVGLLLDPLSGMMLVVASLVSLLVQVYSLAYMHGDPGFARYYSYLSLFTGSMMGLVLSPNLLQMYVFYELVGLSSFLLIGFWFTKQDAVEAAKKAFVTTRIGDFGLLLGILLLFWAGGPLSFRALGTIAGAEAHGGAAAVSPVLAVAAVLIFSGAVGKSAQFPLHVWLPDAMAGPTPVSALIHAATMVAAGVYLVARTFPLFAAQPLPALAVAYIGGITAFFAATIAVAQDDIKKVLAYSTISQLGLMILGLGAGGYTAGLFHLMTHAFFKALLFLGAGSVIFGYYHLQDIWTMGGLARRMPVTAVTFGIGSLSLAGIPPLAGFFSKDEILLTVRNAGHLDLYLLGLATSFLTAFYMARVFFVVFLGPENPHPPVDHHHSEVAHAAPRESPAVMTWPLVILAFLAITAGWVGWPGWERGIGHYLHFGGEEPHFSPVVAVTASAVGLLGILLGYLLYGRKRPAEDPLRAKLGGLYTLLRNKYYVDEFYELLGRYVVRAISSGLTWFDRHVVDGAVDAVGTLTIAGGLVLRRWQSGEVQRYAIWFAGLLLLAFLVWLFAGPNAAAGGLR